MKKETMEEIEKYMKEAEETENKIKAVITDVEEMDSKEYFGTTEYKNRDGIKVYFESDDKVEQWNEFYALIHSRHGFSNPKSKLGNFARKYGTYPKVGLKVDAEIDENGFFKVIV